MNFYNRVLDKKGLKRIVSWFIENYGPTRTSVLLDDFKYLGFHYAGQAGLSLGFDDLRIPSTKKLLLDSAQKQVQDCEKTYIMGRITAFERYQKLIDIWTTTSEKLKDEVIQNFEKIQGGPLASPLYMMAFSGARGNISQVRQLVGMRGLMSDSGGGIIDFPIRSNFREGLSVTEYVISCYGARKGLIDTALRTADSGYLTRRLVDVAHGIIIREIDCGSLESISMRISDIKNLVGRVLAETVNIQDLTHDIHRPEVRKNQTFLSQAHSVAHSVALEAGELPPPYPASPPENKNRILWRNQEISLSVALELKSLNGQKASVQVRSPLTCLSQSVCQLCYGWNLAQGRLVSLGDAVGILAAQSIGEPGTQLTMRTFHTGGVFSTEVEDKLYSPQDGSIFLQKRGGLPARPEVPGCKIRSVHGQTAFFFFDSIQLKIKSPGSAAHPVALQHALVPAFSTAPLGTPSVAAPKSERSSPQESILQLPAQSILFLSAAPGKYIRKNSLFAEISRIKQPPEKIQEINGVPTGGRPKVTGQPPLNVNRDNSSNLPGGTETRASSGKSVSDLSVKQSTVSFPPQTEGPPPQKKVFSEIQGEVVEKALGELLNPGKASLAPSGVKFSTRKLKESTRSGTGTPSVAGPKVPHLIKSRIVLAAEPFIFKRNSTLKAGKKTMGEELRSEGGGSFAPQKYIKKQTDVQDLFNPGRFHHPPPPPAGGFEHKENESSLLSLDSKKMELPFRMGDVLFWKGKRKLNPQEMRGGLPARNGLPPIQAFGEKAIKKAPEGYRGVSPLRPPRYLSPKNTDRWKKFFQVQKQEVVGDLRSRAGEKIQRSDLLKNQRSRGPLPPSVLWSSIQAFEIRRIEGERGGPSVALEAPPHAPITSSQVSPLSRGYPRPNLSGLILLFDQQKQKNISGSFAPATPGPAFGEKTILKGGTEGGIPPVAPRPQKIQIGKIIQPHIALNYLTTDLKLENGAFGSAAHPVAPSVAGRMVKPAPVAPQKERPRNALNIPTQIIRKRSQKVILRRVQPHLGGENTAAENKHPNLSSLSLSPGKEGSKDRVGERTEVSRMTEGRLSLQKSGDLFNRSGPPPKASIATRYVKERDLLFHLVLPISQSSSSSDIVQGLPKIEQLFEARSKNENTGNRSSLAGEGSPAKLSSSSFGKKAQGAKLSSGASPPSLRSHAGVSLLKTELRNLQKRLIQEIQAVYNSQGVEIADKHLEIIVRQMTSRIRILEKGNTPFFPEDIVEFFGQQGSGLVSSKTMSPGATLPPTFERESGGRFHHPPRPPKNFQSLTEIPAYEWVLLGITKVALLATTESYISAASFQETKRVLMSSALQSRVDFFEGLKENVIVGRIIPAGTGYKNC